MDASKSVEEAGWSAESSFAVKLIESMMKEGNPTEVGIIPYYFKADMYLIGQSGGKNAAGVFQQNEGETTSAIESLVYADIEGGNTCDHPQVFRSAGASFQQGRSDRSKLLLLVTDGATKKGAGCEDLVQSTVEAKIGQCTATNGHVCSELNCDMSTCMCGVYTAALFKDDGYQLAVAGIGDEKEVGTTQAGHFRKQIEEMASPGGAFYAAQFEDLDGLVSKVFNYVTM
jgi:hypothetical protein